MEGHWKFRRGGMGDLNSQNLKRRVWGLTGISTGVGVLKPKNLPWDGYGYFLEQHNNILTENEVLEYVFEFVTMGSCCVN